MALYKCRFAGDSGKVEFRTMAADSAGDCRRSLEEEGKLVLSVRREWISLGRHRIELGRRIKHKDVILFNQEFLALLKAGYPIFRSLEAIGARAKNQTLKGILSRAAEDIKRGKLLSDAFKPYEKYFSAVYTAALMSGERSGNLPSTLARYIEYIKTVSQTGARIRTALAYPTLIIIFGLILMGLLLTFVLPRFADFYLSFEAELPFISRMVMSISFFLNKYYYVIFGFLAVLVYLYFRAGKSGAFRLKTDRLKLRLPLGGPIWLESGVSFFSRTLGLLLEAGIALVPAIEVAVQAVPNRFMRSKLNQVADFVRNGEPLTESLAKVSVFPPVALDMIRIGENSANLQGMLADLADFFDERVRGKIDTVVSLVEPAVIIITGIMVAGMLLSVYLPIFNIIRIAR